MAMVMDAYASSLDAPARAQRRAAVVVDSTPLALESDAVERLRGEDERAHLLRAPLVDGEDWPTTEDDLA